MPKGFNLHEKQIIKTALLQEGKFLFSTYGLKKTSIEDITKAVSIAQGSFYIFYTCKEELYFDILEIEQEKIKDEFLKDDVWTGQPPKMALIKIFERTFEMIENNPIIKQLYVENSMQTLLRKLPIAKMEAHIRNDSASLLPVITKWQKEGLLRKKDPEVIAAILRSIFLLSLHKREIGETIYRDTITLMIELIADGLIHREGESC
jgi:AcrR family transcriptional regulator